MSRGGFSTASLRTPVFQYFFVKELPYQNTPKCS